MRIQDAKKFSHWLSYCGAIILPITNPYEVVRADTSLGILVVYKNKLGRITLDERLCHLYLQFSAGLKIKLSPDTKPRQRLRGLIERISERDGLACWFTGLFFDGLDDPEITIEHLCPKSHGGPDHLSNLVLADKKSNQLAGNMSVAEKVLLREKLKGLCS